MQKRSLSSRRHLRFVLAVALAFVSLGGIAWSQGYVTFDIHTDSNKFGTCNGATDCQLIQGSIYVPLSSPPVQDTNYNFGIGASNAINGFYLVPNSGFTDMVSSTGTNVCCSATETPALNFGLGSTQPSPDQNGSTRTFAGTITYTVGSGWWVSSVSFGFTNSGGQYWVEGTANSPNQGGTLDIHAATLLTSGAGAGTYASSTAGTGTVLVNSGIKSQCMNPGSAGLNYCATLASDPILNPEINAGGLPKVALLLSSLYVMRRYFKGGKIGCLSKQSLSI